MHEVKNQTAWRNYKTDFKKAFGPRENLYEKTSIELWEISQNMKNDEEDDDFAESSIARQDFILGQLTSNIPCEKESVKRIKEMLDIKCLHDQKPGKKYKKSLKIGLDTQNSDKKPLLVSAKTKNPAKLKI